jgi:Family of unknown function (DUF6174)
MNGDIVGRWSRRLGLVMALGVIAGCALVAPEDHEAVQRDLNRARRQWEAQGLEDYRFVMRRLCFCGQEIVAPVVVEVSDGSVESQRYQETEEAVEARHADLWPTIEGLFALVQDAIDRDAFRIEVEYDRERGHPVSIGIDYQENVVDEELGVVVEGVEVRS